MFEVLKMSNVVSEIKRVSKILMPVETIKYIIEKLGNDIIWDYNSITGEIIIMKRPESYADALAGLGKDMWEKAGGTKYIEEMRAEWDK